MAARNSLKTPINKALLTPCRRIGLSKPKKTPKRLNLDSPGPSNVSSPFAKAVENKVTPLTTPKEHVVKVVSSSNHCVTSPLISPLAKPLINNLAEATVDSSTHSKPLNVDVSSLVMPIDRNIPIINNTTTPLKTTTVTNKKSKKLFENSTDQKKSIKEANMKNQELVKKCKDNLANKVKKIENYFSDSDEDTFKKTDDKKRKKVVRVIDSSSDKLKNEKSQEKISDLKNHEGTKLLKKVPIFRKETSSIKAKESLGNSPLPIGKFRTSDWLEEEEFRVLREKEFEWKKDEKQNFHEDSEEEKFIVDKEKPTKINSKSKLENLQENFSENIKIISQHKPIQQDVSSDDEFSKNPIKLRKKSSTLKEKRITLVKNDDDKITKSKKLKKEVTVNLEKIDEIVLKNCNVNSALPDITENNKKDKQKLLDQVNTMKSLIKQKEQILENLKQAEIYMNKHDTKDLNNLTNIWLKGCQQAIHDLLQLLKQHGPITMRSLLIKLQIPPEILDKLKIEVEDDS